MSDNNSNNQSGYSIPELIVALSVFAILSVAMLSALSSFFFTIIRNNTLIDMTVTAQGFLRSTEENIRYGSGVRPSNTINDPNAPVGGWNTSNSNFVVIIAVPAVDSSRKYIIDTATGAPYMNELVYYRENNLLLQRTLAHPSATGNSVATSCPPSSATASCRADKRLLENLDTISFVFYNQDNIITADPLLARSIEINLTTSKDTFGQPLALDSKVRVTLRNRFQ